MEGSTGRCFIKPSRSATQEPTAHLYVANCGPAVGIPYTAIEDCFRLYGPIVSVQPAGDSGSRVYISYENVRDAVAARQAWNLKPCASLQGRVMVIQHAVPLPQPSVEEHSVVFMTGEEVGIPGISLYTDFVSPEEERELLTAVDERPWQILAKRRVQHYGYEFSYKTRNVDVNQKLGELPPTVAPVLLKMSSLPEIIQVEEASLPLDQLTVNEYPRGVGLSPHIDTHSAFQGSIMSLSLAGPCVMEFRKYVNKFDFPAFIKSRESEGPTHLDEEELSQQDDQVLNHNSGGLTEPAKSPQVDKPPQPNVEMERKALWLPQRSLLVLSREARYAWHHYIPHHKIDNLNGHIVSRGPRRVSFTFRKVRFGPCTCSFPEYCDSQVSDLGTPNPSTTSCVLTLERLRISNSTDTNGKLVDMTGNSPCSVTSNTVNSEGGDEGLALLEVGSEVGRDGMQDWPKPLNSVTPEIEKTYVHKVYDAIAPHFSATRFAKWPKVALFLDSLDPGSIIVDAGCGNGKYLGLNPRCLFIGCDISAPLVTICAQKGHEALVADALHLPYRTGIFDAAISIAVLHHLSNEERRIRAMEELLRVVGPKGKVLITVWALEQEDENLVAKWTPLTSKYMEEWVDNVGTKVKRSLSTNSLGSIQEGENGEGERDFNPRNTFKEEEDSSQIGYPSCNGGELLVPQQQVVGGGVSAKSPVPDTNCGISRHVDKYRKDSSPQNLMLEKGGSDDLIDRGPSKEQLEMLQQGLACSLPVEFPAGNGSNHTCNDSETYQEEQQEYFVPWHLPYHRAEVGGASAAAVASGLARKDDEKRAVVYNRYYHCFVEGELERLATNIQGARIIDHFYDKSNWCVIIEKLQQTDIKQEVS